MKFAYCVCLAGVVAEWPVGRQLKQCKRKHRKLLKCSPGRKEDDAANLQMPRGEWVLHHADVLEHPRRLSRGRRPPQKDVQASEEGIKGGGKKPVADGNGLENGFERKICQSAVKNSSQCSERTKTGKSHKAPATHSLACSASSETAESLEAATAK